MLHVLLMKLLLRNDERRKRPKDSVKIPVLDSYVSKADPYGNGQRY